MAEQPLALDDEALELVEEETEYDLAFPLLPLEDDPSPPDEDETLVDDLDDFADDEVEDDILDPATAAAGDDWAMDWDEEEFFFDSNGDPLRVTGDEAVAEWALKALNTPRGVYPIYSPEYGSDLWRVLGQPMPDAVLNAEIHRSVSECLEQHPRIEGAEIVQMVRRDGVLQLTIAMTLDDSDEPVILEVNT